MISTNKNQSVMLIHFANTLTSFFVINAEGNTQNEQWTQ